MKYRQDQDDILLPTEVPEVHAFLCDVRGMSAARLRGRRRWAVATVRPCRKATAELLEPDG